MPPFRRFLLILCALTLTFGSATALSACGGSGDEDVEALLKETFGPNKPVKSGDLAMGLKLDLKGIQNLNGPVALKLKGPFASQGDNKLPRFDFTATLGASGQNFSAGAVSTGTKGFVKFQGKSYVLTDAIFAQFRKGYEDAQKAGKTKDSKNASFQSLGIDPSRWLKDAKKSGEEDIGGAETVHIEAGIDPAKFLEDVSKLLKRASDLGVAGPQRENVPNELTAEQRERIAAAVKNAEMDLWTGKDDKTLRKIALVVDLEVPKDQQQATRGLQSGRITFDLTIAELNEDQQVTEPKGARPLAELQEQFGQLLGGGAGGGSGATPPPAAPSPPGASGGAGASDEYLQCLQKAGEDVAKVQACADLLRPSG